MGHAHPQSAPWQGLTPLWNRRAPTLCLLGFCVLLIQPHMEQRCLQKLEKQTNPQQALQPFLPLFLPLLPSSLASLPSPDGHSCFRHMAEASMGVCMAWGKDQVLTGREPALLSSCFAAQGRKAKLQRTWQGVGTSIRMQIPALGFLGPSSWGIPRAFHTHCQLLSLLTSSLGERRDRH